MRKTPSVVMILLSAAVGLAAAAGSGPAAAADQSTWDKIKSTGKLTQCVVEGHAYWGNERDGYPGFVAEMGRDLAKHLKVDSAYHKTTSATRVLDIQGSRCDIYIGVNMTPERWLALDFAGPLWKFSYVAINRKGFDPGTTWQHYNKPEITLGSVMATADSEAAQAYAPRAKLVALQKEAEVVMAVQSGRVDAMIVTAMIGLDAKKKNPELGTLTPLTPQYGLSAYGGVRKDGDGRFLNFVQNWSTYNRELGNYEKWIRGHLAKLGFAPDDVPPELSF